MGNMPSRTEQLPSHVLPLSYGDWTIWKNVGLRGAGFPAAEILRVAFPECADAAYRVAEAEAERRAAGERAMAWVNEALDEQRRNGQWDDKTRRRPLLKALGALSKGKLPSGAGGLAEQPEWEPLLDSEEKLEEAREAFARSYGESLVKQSEEIREIASTPRFREAVLWQNRGAYHTGLRQLVRESSPEARRTSQVRQHEEMVASYLQRYTVKNDTIGFFGPMGWARWAEDGAALDVRPGPDLISRRDTYVESWCFDTLAETLGRQRVMRPWLFPRRLPSGPPPGAVASSEVPAAALWSPAHAAVLEMSDGSRTAVEIARDVIEDAALGTDDEEQVYELLEDLRKARRIDLGFHVPVGPRTGAVLEEQFRKIGDARLRKVAMLALGAIEKARRSVGEAAGDVEKLDQALDRMDSTFERLTGSSTRRNLGQTYAGRTLAYEDCLRDVEVDVGPELRHAVEKPLSLVLESSRWLTSRVARSVYELFQEAYGELSRLKGTSVIDALALWKRVRPVLLDLESSEALNNARAACEQKWLEIFGVGEDVRRADFTTEELRDRVCESFHCHGAGWQLARYHSPDVMIAAESVEAVRRGEYQLILGEIHTGTNTLNNAVFLEGHPDREEIHSHMDLDLPDSRPVLLAPKDYPGLTSRTQLSHFSQKDFFVPPPEEAVPPPDPRIVQISSMVFEESGGTVFIRTCDGRHRFDVVDFCGNLISHQVSSQFSFLPSGRHWPRITIDRMVLSRESWSFEARDLGFCAAKEGADRFLGAQRFAREFDLPRFIFVKVPIEVKPFYCDLASPIYVDNLAKMIRRLRKSGGEEARVKVSEMLPRVDQSWLPDAEGRRYCCELRLVVLDRKTVLAPSSAELRHEAVHA